MKPSLIASFLLAGLSVATLAAQTTVVYNSIPKSLAANVGSEGPEAYGFAELGDGFSLSGGGTISQVNVVLSSWACQSGAWTSGCVSSSGATFSQPVTVNLYSVKDELSNVYGTSVPKPAALIGTVTQTFNIPYRPSTSTNCTDHTGWYNSKDKSCYHGLATIVAVNFSSLKIAVPTDRRLIVTVAYNTTTEGPSPIGTAAACYNASGGCPYDSLNISTDGNGSVGIDNGVGFLLDPNGLFINYRLSNNACPNNNVTGVVALDTGIGCWATYHPQISVAVNANGKGGSKGLTPLIVVDGRGRRRSTLPRFSYLLQWTQRPRVEDYAGPLFVSDCCFCRLRLSRSIESA